MNRFALAAVVAALAPALAPVAARAQLGSYNPPPGPQGTFAITHARIVPVSGAEIPNGTVVISGGKIQAVGANVAVPNGAQVIDATGLSVYPGMMDAGTSIGLQEIPQGAASTVDIAETGNFNPNAQAFFGINPHSAHVGVARVVGITHVLSHPTGGVISGQAALINLAGSTVPQMAVEPRAAMVIELPRAGFGGGRRGGFAAFAGAQNQQEVARTRQLQLDSLKSMLKDAAAYGDVQDAYAKDKSIPRPKQDVVLASLVPAVRGQMSVLFVADRANDIREAVAFAEENKLKPVILGGRDAVQVAAFLKQHDVPVLLGGVMDLPSREDDPYDVNYAAPAKLAAAGVRFAITSGDLGSEVRNLPYTAGMAAAFGLSKDNALKSVTLWPAQILGVGDRLGSLEPGKIANVVVTTGDILEARTDTKYLFIDGRPVPLDTKHSELYKQFKDRP
ncbi:amidohydrolase [Gemmatirosa kalamazoonensis]|uniref:Amidohydrolase n=1 Tax=Gemmatirosa kalamazoonensis TaxID=861299 RepID=W0RFV9_9BACT|nr:amidohydrolase family protein [Gemmatirosa kalamazoonensis]AHG88273.1 amidohydrolase [Gemmatirosa kalamazoonensis]